MSPSFIMWGLWKQINRKFFKNSKLRCEQVTLKMEVIIIEILNSKLYKNHEVSYPMTPWDGKMRKN